MVVNYYGDLVKLLRRSIFTMAGSFGYVLFCPPSRGQDILVLLSWMTWLLIAVD